jgi:hypothetical protein
MKFLRGEGREIVLAPLSVLRDHSSYRPTVVDVQQDDEDGNESDNMGWGQSSQPDDFGRVGRSSSQASMRPPPGLEPVVGEAHHLAIVSPPRHEFVRPIGMSNAEWAKKERTRQARSRQRDRKRRRINQASDTSGN